jgi:uncharacterized protein YkwD
MRSADTNRSRCSRTQRSAERSPWAWAIVALLLFSIMGSACQPQPLSYGELAELFVEDDWLTPSLDTIGEQAGSQNQAGQNSVSPSSESLQGSGNDDKSGTKPTPTRALGFEKSFPSASGGDEATATPTATETPSPTWTPTRSVIVASPTSTSTREVSGNPATATPTLRSATATPTLRVPSATPTTRTLTNTPTTAAPTATPTTAPPTATSSVCNFSSSASYESTLISLINQERTRLGIAPMTTSSQLTAAARQHSRDMACNDFFSHTGSDGSSPFDRIASSGFSFTAAAENIYAGSGSYNSPQQAFNGWMNSSGHRTNMLNPTYTHIGVGYIYNASSTYGGYFTADFARP